MATGCIRKLSAFYKYYSIVMIGLVADCLQPREPMKQRSGIQSQLIAAWEDCIASDYCSQKINSERSLQASLWTHIYNHLPQNRRLFIEPSFRISSNGQTKRLVPDIAICNSREVIAVVEIKYLPRGKPKYTKDVETLDLLSRHRSKLSASNVRFYGEGRDPREYSFSKNMLFVWAGVHKDSASNQYESYAKGMKSLDGCYLQLHAETRKGQAPKVFCLES